MKRAQICTRLFTGQAVSGIPELSIICLLHNVGLLSPDTGPGGMCVTLASEETSVDQFVTKFNQCTPLSLSNIIGASVCYWSWRTNRENVKIEANLTNRTESLHTLLTKNHQVLLNFPTSSLSIINYASHVGTQS